MKTTAAIVLHAITVKDSHWQVSLDLAPCIGIPVRSIAPSVNRVDRLDLRGHICRNALHFVHDFLELYAGHGVHVDL